MNWEQIEGNWKQMKGKIREKWAKLTDQDMEAIGGKKDRFLGLMKERYGIEKEKASAELDRWMQAMKDDNAQQRTSSPSMP
jgi:uncharacterized protein YjbJ (UPF0337 family)